MCERLNETGDGRNAEKTAVKVAAGVVVMGNATVGTVVTKVDKIGMQVTAGQWYNDVLIPLEYEGEYPEYTHLVFTSSSSSRGDKFKATPDSILILDNIRIVYEGDQ